MALQSSWAWLAGALALLVGSCAEKPAPPPPVPALPAYVAKFDSRVQDILNENHTVLVQHPLDPQCWMNLGMVFEAHREVGQAEIYYSRAVELEPRIARWWYRLAMAQEIGDRVEAAVKSLEHSIELDNNYPPSHWRRGQWKLEMGETDEARASFERALSIDPKCEAALVGLAQVHLWLGENEKAIAILEQESLLQGPSGPFVHRQLGTAYQRMGQIDRARTLLAGVTDAKQHFPDPWKAEVDRFQRGLATINRQARQWIATGQAQRAVVELEKAHAMEPDHIPILRTLGAAYSSAGKTAQALEALQKARAMDPADLELQVDAAWARAIDGDLAGALVEADDIIARDPTNHKAHALRTQLLLDLGRGPEATAAYGLAMKYGHHNPRLLVDVGRVQMDQGHMPQAQASFKLAAEQDPALQSAWIGLAIAAVDLKQLDQAQASILRAAALTPAGSAELPIIGIVRDQIVSLKR